MTMTATGMNIIAITIMTITATIGIDRLNRRHA